VRIPDNFSADGLASF